jgi:hypothetical protein
MPIYQKNIQNKNQFNVNKQDNIMWTNKMISDMLRYVEK